MQTLRKTAVLMLILLGVSINVFAAGEPVEIIRGQTEDKQTIEKVYILQKDENPDEISRDAFIETETEYTFVELKTQDNSKEETKEHSQTISIQTNTGNAQSVIPKFKTTLDISTEDGFTGTLEPDFSTLNIAAAGYGKQTYTITENRTYPNLMDADTSLVPKSINKDGSTLNLTNISWQTAASDNIDGHDLAVRYTAVASYSGTGTKTYTKGYTASVTYKGELKKTVDDTITYTAVFHGIPKPTPEPEPEKNHFLSWWWAYLLGLLGLGGAGYGTYRLIRKRKKGY